MLDKVYLLTKFDGNDTNNYYCLGVYTTITLAEKALELYLNEWAGDDDEERHAIKQDLDIIVMKLDVAPPSWNELVKNK